MKDAIPFKKPNPKAIKELEGILEDAKSGDLVGFIFIGVHSDGCVSSGWIPAPHHYNDQLISRRVVGELEYTKLALMSHERWVERLA